jgi:hypothetical protein
MARADRLYRVGSGYGGSRQRQGSGAIRGATFGAANPYQPLGAYGTRPAAAGPRVGFYADLDQDGKMDMMMGDNVEVLSM